MGLFNPLEKRFLAEPKTLFPIACFQNNKVLVKHIIIFSSKIDRENSSYWFCKRGKEEGGSIVSVMIF